MEGKLSYQKDSFLKEICKGVNLCLKDLYNRFIWREGVVDNIPIPLLVADKNDNIIFVNQELIDMVELDGKSEDYVGWDVSKFFYGESDRPTVTGKAYKEQKKITGVRKDIIGRKGKEIYIDINAAPLYDPLGNLIGSFAIFVNLSDLKAEQTKTAQQVEILKQLALNIKEISDQLITTSEGYSKQVEKDNFLMKIKNLKERINECSKGLEATVQEIGIIQETC